jgi:hypothetical protein
MFFRHFNEILPRDACRHVLSSFNDEIVPITWRFMEDEKFGEFRLTREKAHGVCEIAILSSEKWYF